MNILYVDLTSMNISEAVSLYEQLSYKLNGDLIMLPMNTRLLYDVKLKDLYDLKAKIDAVIKEKENGTNT